MDKVGLTSLMQRGEQRRESYDEMTQVGEGIDRESGECNGKCFHFKI